MDRPGVLSDAYWGMHRNSLVLSGLCLLLSLVDVSIGTDQQNAGVGLAIRIGKDGGAVIQYGVFLAALYAFVVFVMEWRQQAWPALREAGEARQDVRDQETRVLRQISDRLESAISGLSRFQAIVETRQGGLPALRQLTAHEYVHADPAGNPERVFERIADFPNQIHQLAQTLSFPDEAWQFKQSVDPMISAFRRDCQRYANIRMRDLNRQIAQECDVGLARAGDAISQSLADLRELNRINGWVRRKYIAHVMDRSAAAFRLIHLGLVLPALLLAIAAVHFVGKHIAGPFGTLLSARYLS